MMAIASKVLYRDAKSYLLIPGVSVSLIIFYLQLPPMFDKRTVKQLTARINQRDWYRQGGAIWLFYGFSPYLSMNETLGYDRNIYFQRGDHNIAFFDREAEYRLALREVRRQKKDRKTIDRRIALWRKQIRAVMAVYRKKFAKPVVEWSDAELASFITWHHQHVLRHWITAVLIEWTDPDGDKILQDEVCRTRCPLAPKDIQALIAPRQLSFVQEELVSRYRLARQYAAGKDIARGLRSHQKRFYWYRNNWAYVHDLDETYFQKHIQQDAKRLAAIASEVRVAYKTLRSNARRSKILLTSGKIPTALRNVFYMFQRMADWRDERKKYSTNITNDYLHKILERLAKENSVSEQLISVLVPYEMSSWKLSPRMKQILKKRLSFSAFLCTNEKKYGWLYGREAKRLYQLMAGKNKSRIIQGTVANPGKTIGFAKLVETKADFAKFKTGDIIVAHMTRPEYVPLLRRAAAIVTDEGGLTCHAAIISRELGIPCLIGTQIATHVLKDGDRVEVDATKGIVRKL